MKLALFSKFKGFWQRLWNEFSPRQQREITISFLVVFALSSFTLGYFSLRNHLVSPFYVFLPSDGTDLNFSLPTEDDEQLAKIQEDQQKDTDGDGLNDYEEVYVHNTSPYIEDTDSDGYTDKQEIDTQNNPLCPAGGNCLGTGTSQGPLSSELLNDPKELRAALVSLGIKQAEVDALTDEEVKEKYVTLATSGSTTATENSEAAQIRNALLQAGVVDQKTLDTLTDEELLQLYKETQTQPAP